MDSYYATGKADWLGEAQLKKVVDRAEDLRYSQCGERIPNIILPDTSQTNWVSLYDVDAKYTLVSIWESTCGHCKKEMPKLEALYEEWHEKGLGDLCDRQRFRTEPWLEFVREKNIGDWIHVSDNPQINATDSATALIMAGVTTEELEFPHHVRRLRHAENVPARPGQEGHRQAGRRRADRRDPRPRGSRGRPSIRGNTGG